MKDHLQAQIPQPPLRQRGWGIFNSSPSSGEAWFSHKHEDKILIVNVYCEVSASRPRVLYPTRSSFNAALRFMWRIAPALFVKPAQKHGVAVIGFCLVLCDALCLHEVDVFMDLKVDRSGQHFSVRTFTCQHGHHLRFDSFAKNIIMVSPMSNPDRVAFPG